MKNHRMSTRKRTGGGGEHKWENLEERGDSCLQDEWNWTQEEVEEASSVYRHTHKGAPAAY